jgi:hypothetical protein
MSVTIEVPIPDELLPILERKARRAGLKREEYVTALVSRDLSAPKALDEVLAAFREQVAGSGISDNELSALFAAARDETQT